jgi:hypothetical protein
MKKLEIIGTADYILAVSDEEIIKGDFVILTNNEIIEAEEGDGSPKRKCKIIAYQPKENAPELDLPLLPEMIVEDDVERLAEKHLQFWRSKNNIHLSKIIHAERCKNDFKAGYKAATKVYSEEDLRNAMHFGKFGEYNGITTTQEFIQSLKQPKTFKWFIAEMEITKSSVFRENDVPYAVLKTTTNSSGKKVLVGTYEYE